MSSLRKLMVRMLQATRLNRAAHRLYYQHLHGFASATPALPGAVDRCFELASPEGLLDCGDYCEFGIFKGATLWHAHRLATTRYPDSPMRFFGFDSFQGLPHLTHNMDRSAHNEFYPGQYACAYDDVRRMMDKAGTDWQRTFLIKGFFSDSLTDAMAEKFDLRHVAIALVDCDLYTSTAHVLHFLAQRLCDGAILLMDDWGCFRGDPNRGQQRAMRECLAQTGATVEPLFTYGAWSQAMRWRGSSSTAKATFEDESLASVSD